MWNNTESAGIPARMKLAAYYSPLITRHSANLSSVRAISPHTNPADGSDGIRGRLP